MRWNPLNSGDDVIDARGSSGSRMGGSPIGLIAMLLFNRRTRGLGIVAILFFVGLQVFGGGGGFDVSNGFGGQVGAGGGTPRGIPASQDPEKDLKDFSAYVFVTAQRGWQSAFEQQGKPYEKAKLVLYRRGVNTSGCGFANSSVGPFYCPGDRRVYIDLGFYRDMTDVLGAPGDLAWAYVIAHEVGHHVQQQLGTEATVRDLQREEPGKMNELSVRLELQADCFAGIWAHRVYTQGDLEQGDLDEALNAAAAVGDDRIQKNAGGGVNPDSFTHGSSAQRQFWFTTGYKSGKPADCDTFSVEKI